MNDEKVRFFTLGNLIYFLTVILIPAIIGGILALIFKTLLYLEILFVIFGLVDLCLITVRLRFRDSRNYKKTKSIVEDKTTRDYKEWKNTQYVIAIVGVIDLFLSLVVFWISKSI